MDLMWIQVHRSWRLNERHYGALQGLNKAEVAAQMGEDQVFTWRRSYNVRPPILEKTDPRYPGNDSRYRYLAEGEVPLTECLKDTVNRFIPYWHQTIAPAIKSGERVLLAAHGNSLRALVKCLENVSDDDIANYNIPTGIPLVYELDSDLRYIRNYYLGEPGEVKLVMESISKQGIVS